jgi:lipopolysaccharide/colanic/teichoic acid biosynthesis glycosyltransferase
MITPAPAQRSPLPAVSTPRELHLDAAPFPARARPTGAEPGSSTAKHVLDVVGAATALGLLLPLLVSVAIAVRLSSNGPIFVRHLRQGYKGRSFWLVKFCTWALDAEDRLRDLVRIVERDAVVPSEDPVERRSSWWGRWLRHTGLDELSQLLNVLHGEMSLVGPRPLPMREDVLLKQLDPEGYRRRLAALPGLTGPWRLGRQGQSGPWETHRLDLDYIDHWSLRCDLAILCQAIAAPFRRRAGS